MTDRDQEPELLPCPFCGEKPHRFDGTQYYSIRCDTPECVASPSVDINKDSSTDFRSVAVTQWNTRPPSERPVPQVREALSALTKVAAECHRAKWQFDYNDESRPTASFARGLVKRAFDELHRAGDLALKLRDELAALTAKRPEATVAWRDKVFEVIEKRLRDLAEANALYGKDQLLDAPSKVERNNREISWLKDLRSMLRVLAIPHEEPGRNK